MDCTKIYEPQTIGHDGTITETGVDPSDATPFEVLFGGKRLGYNYENVNLNFYLKTLLKFKSCLIIALIRVG